MNVTQKDFDFMKLCMTRELVILLMEEKGYTMQQALEILYNSWTYEKLSNPESGLFFQSPRYVFSFLENEI
ncbi:MAG: hypothetical protein MJZ52_03150 [Bacteroidales bacterium]|nr:hypothetical protein [Bacteroidales bacterium]